MCKCKECSTYQYYNLPDILEHAPGLKPGHMRGVLAGPGQLGDEVLQEDVGVLQVQGVDDYLDELEQGQAGPPDQGAQAP